MNEYRNRNRNRYCNVQLLCDGTWIAECLSWSFSRDRTNTCWISPGRPASCYCNIDNNHLCMWHLNCREEFYLCSLRVCPRRRWFDPRIPVPASWMVWLCLCLVVQSIWSMWVLSTVSCHRNSVAPIRLPVSHRSLASRCSNVDPCHWHRANVCYFQALSIAFDCYHLIWLMVRFR